MIKMSEIKHDLILTKSAAICALLRMIPATNKAGENAGLGVSDFWAIHGLNDLAEDLNSEIFQLLDGEAKS